MGDKINERWLSRQEVADRFGLPVKTLAQWASKGTGPPFARMGRHVRYRLSDIIDWETARVDDLRIAHRASRPDGRDFEAIRRSPSFDANIGSASRSAR